MRGNTSKRTLSIALVTLLLVGYAGASVGLSTDHSDSADGDAMVRVAHMSPDAPPVDVLVDGETAVENLSFGNVTEYTAVPAGERNVTIQAAGDPSTVVFSGNVTFEADTNYTVAATGEISENATTEFAPVVLEDNFIVPEQNASVRLFHASPDAPPVDVTVEETNTTLFDNVSFQNATDYVEVPAGDYTLEVRPATANDSGEVVATFDVTLNESTVYTAFAAGYLNPEDAPADVPFQLFLAIDATAEKKTTTAAPAKTTPKKTTPKETPRKTTPKETPEKTTPKKTTPKETPRKTTPKKTTPKETPEKTTPKETPKKTTPKETPRKTTPKETPKETPEKTTPKKTTPKETTPKETTTTETTTKTTLKKPETPKTPKTPKTPETPEMPKMTETLEKPETPEKPEKPKTPKEDGEKPWKKTTTTKDDGY
ncbi:DUF4397 domain-containing protein [Halomicrococcus sp. NG-SE-24]|uniref:DUF4397 domain-containing protein n=1 Tax=Halomicrococcus sp. NG-SE-24 TaxID=3436928 RepID=UPI003D96C898